MDKQGRLTRYDEWVVGKAYKINADIGVAPIYVCLAVSPPIIVLSAKADGISVPITLRYHSWRKRFVLAGDSL